MTIVCPKCRADPMYSKKRGVYVCEECGHEWSGESLRSEHPPLPLRLSRNSSWFPKGAWGCSGRNSFIVLL